MTRCKVLPQKSYIFNVALQIWMLSILRSQEERGGCFLIGDCRELAQSGCGFNNYQSHRVESRQGLGPAYIIIYKGSDDLSGLCANTA